MHTSKTESKKLSPSFTETFGRINTDKIKYYGLRALALYGALSLIRACSILPPTTPSEPTHYIPFLSEKTPYTQHNHLEDQL